MNFCRKRQRGAVTLMGALFVIVTLLVMVQAVNRMAGSDITDTITQNDAVEALFIAETGIEYAAYTYASNGGNCPGLQPAIGVTNAGRGSFDVTASALAGTDCRITVEATVSSMGSGAPDAAMRIVSADLRLAGGSVVAVGDNGTILRWDGANWNAETSNTSEDLMAVYCPTTNQCWATGTGKRIYEWTGGTNWTTVYTPADNDGSFNAIECVPNDPNDCYAVGLDVGFKGIQFKVTRHWDGLVWSDSGNGGGAVYDFFTDISCPDTNCYAITRNGESRTSATAWSIDDTYTTEYQYGIDCYSAVECWSVGDKVTGGGGNNVFRFYRRNAGGWNLVTLNSNSAANMRGVSCADANSCKAVGETRSNRFVITSWNGASWVDESSNLGGNDSDNLNGVHCVQANNCWAVGDHRNGRAFGNSLFWDGANWAHVPTPVTENLNGVFILGNGGGGSVSLVRWQELVNN